MEVDAGTGHARADSQSLRLDLLPEGGREGEAVQVDAESGLAELRIMAAAETGSQLDHARAFGPKPQLRRGGALLDPERPGGQLGNRRGGLSPVARPDVGQLQAVHHGQRPEVAAARERGHRHLRPLRELLDEAVPTPRGPQRRSHRLLQLLPRAHEREAAPAVAIGGLDDAREPELVVRLGHDFPARLRHPGLFKALPLAQLRAREHRGCRRDRVR